jgi:hypothetical protein
MKDDHGLAFRDGEKEVLKVRFFPNVGRAHDVAAVEFVLESAVNDEELLAQRAIGAVDKVEQLRKAELL